MYISKYFTCEEIDQRLLEGYYNDFVTAGFAGSKEEFFSFVLGIANKVEKRMGYDLSQNDFTDALKAKLDSIDEGARALTKLSELENDVKYQTQEDVEKYINDLLGGADQALDTLKELADALGNDPNFAATIATKLGELRTLLDNEVARATNKESELGLAIDALNTKVDTKHQEVLNLIQAKDQDYQSDHANLQTQITKNKDDILKFTSELRNTLLSSKAYTDEKVLAEHDRARDAENALQDNITTLAGTHTADKAELTGLIEAEATNRAAADATIIERINQAHNAHVEDIHNIQNNINTEISQRQAADENLTNLINTETSNRRSELSVVNANLEKEVDRAKSAEASLDGKIATETSLRESAEEIINHRIDDLTGAVNTSDASLTEKLNKEIQDRKDADAALADSKVDKKEGYTLSKNDFTDILKAKLDNIQEYANYVTKVSQLTNDAGYQTEEEVEAAIQKVVDLAPDALNTLKELSEALGNDPNFATTITTRITQLAEQLNQETENRENADQALQTNIDKVNASITTSIDSAKTQLKEYVDHADADLTTLITANSDSITTEVADRKEAITEVKQLITNEKSSRETADIAINSTVNDLKDKVADLNVALNTGLSQLRTDLTARIDANGASITTLEGQVEVLKQSVQDLKTGSNTSIAELQGKISGEIEARKLADESLDTKITNNQNNLNTEVLRATAAEKVLQDKYNELNDAYKVADTSLKDTLMAKIQEEHNIANEGIASVTNNLITEISNREAGDTVLQNSIAALETTTNTKIDAVKDNVTTLNENLLREVNRATNEETAIKGTISTLDQNHTDDITAVNSALGNKVDKKEGYALSKNDFTDALKSKLEGIEAGANSVTKVSQLVNDSGYQTATDVNLIVQGVIDTAPEALNTLRELADALGDDPNFAATINNKITELNTGLTNTNKDVELVKESVDNLTTSNTAQDGLIATNVANIQRNLELIQGLRTQVDTQINTLIALVEKYQDTIDGTKSELEAAIAAEAATRELEDGLLSDRINAEKTARENADNTLTGNLNAEIAARKAVTGFNGNVYQANTSTNYISAATSLKGADEALDAQVKANNTLINNETTRAQQAEQNLTTELNTVKESVGDNAESIASLLATVNNLTTELNEAKTKIAEMDNTLKLINA